MERSVLMIPNFILKRLYKKGSLCRIPGGTALVLLNRVGTGQISSIDGITVDGIRHSASEIDIHAAGRQVRRADSVRSGSPLPLEVGVEAVLKIRGLDLDEGKHELTISLTVLELGPLEIRFTDSPHGFRDDLTPGSDESEAVSSPCVSAEETAAIRITPSMQARMPVKVVLMGAGSAVFSRNLINDILCIPGLESGSFALVDVDKKRLKLAHSIAEKMVASSGNGWKVESSPERREMLAGADFVISMIEVSGLANVDNDYRIPLKYGIDQCVGDTIGPGGIFKMLRTGPAWMAILRDIAELCPRAMVLNYTNPMSALTLLGLKMTGNPLVGLCHSVQHTSRQLSVYADVPYEELQWECAGINHMAWFTRLEHNGENLYPRLMDALEKTDLSEADRVRFEMMRQFGAFVTESSGHFSEYLPYFRKRADLLEMYTREGQESGESGAYAKNWPAARERGDQTIRDLLAEEGEVMLQRSEEYASRIIEGWLTDSPAVFHGNVLNGGLISNLPDSACVEVPVMVDAKGMHPLRFGALPEQLAALNRTHISVHELMVQAVLNRDREAAVHALMLDPLSAAVCSPAEIRSLFDEMWEAESADLEYFRE